MPLPRLKAILFDLDGVLTDTAKIHAQVWKMLFDEYLTQASLAPNKEFHPFDIDTDYRTYVDGKQRYDGVNSFLLSRGIHLTFGNKDDLPTQTSVCGLGNRKDRLFVERLNKDGVPVFPSSLDFIHRAKDLGLLCGIVSASKNCRRILRSAGIETLFDARVDGMDAETLGLPGKPAPDTFLKCAEILGTSPAQCAVVEDALSGVQAAVRGGFSLVIGVCRHGNKEALLYEGATVAVSDLSEVDPTLFTDQALNDPSSR